MSFGDVFGFLSDLVKGLSTPSGMVDLLILIVMGLVWFISVQHKRYDALVVSKDARFDELRASMQADLQEAEHELGEVNKSFADNNNLSAERLVTMSDSLNAVATTLTNLMNSTKIV